MNYILALFILTSLWILPWWFVVLYAFIYGYLAPKISKALLGVFLTTFICWILIAYFFDMESQTIASQKLALLFHLPHRSWSFILTGLSAAIPSTFAAFVGFTFKRQEDFS